MAIKQFNVGNFETNVAMVKGKVIPLQARFGPEVG
jgi:hypothetical protein